MELMELNSKKEMTTIKDGMLKNATDKINDFHSVAKNALLGISLILNDIANKPNEYLEGSGFASISEYANCMFGYKKAYTYKLIKIAKFITIEDGNGQSLTTTDLINGIEGDYSFNTLTDADGFEFGTSQMLELIPLTQEQIKQNLDKLDSSLSCKELREIVKNIIKPAIEVKATDTSDNKEDKKSETEIKEEKIELTDKDRILQMLEICAGMEHEEIKEKIINVFQKSLKTLEN